MTQASEVAIAMDWGGTWARASVADRQGEILWQARERNPQDGSRAELLEGAEGLLQQAIEWSRHRSIAGIGVAAAGPVDAETGTLHDPPNLMALNGVSLKSLWEPTLGKPVFVGNDANLAALGEFRYGAGLDAWRQGRTPRTLVYVTVSTGVGGGIVDRDQMFLGAHGLAAEVGHMVIDWSPQATPCTCGNTGCLEALSSGGSIARMARRHVAEDGSSGSSLATEDIESLTSEQVFQAAEQGDALAKNILEGVVQALSVGLTNLLHLYNPDLLVLGGGVTAGLTKLGLLTEINSRMLHRAMSERHKDFRLVASQLGDNVGMVGAASLVWKEVGVGVA
ncbi:MAG: ROK family protein [Dehalococcoidia bacterium]